MSTRGQRLISKSHGAVKTFPGQLPDWRPDWDRGTQGGVPETIKAMLLPASVKGDRAELKGESWKKAIESDTDIRPRVLTRYKRVYNYSDAEKVFSVADDVVGVWEGVVQEVHHDDGYFVARVADQDGGSEETLELFLADVVKADREKLVPGAAFYWTVYYPAALGGSHRGRATLLRVRRLPSHSASRRAAAEKAATEYLGYFIDDDPAVRTD